MKNLIIAALLLASTAVQAEEFAWMYNSSGGKIFLTDKPCPIKNMRKKANEALGFTGNGETVTGCWGISKYDESKVMVYWTELDDTLLYNRDELILGDTEDGKSKTKL